MATTHRRSLASKAARVLLSTSGNHAFLDRASIPWLFRVTPQRWRHALGLRLLGLSPHYFIYQYDADVYPTWFTRGQILDAEYRRNADSRRLLAEKVLKPFLRPDMTVLDFGCGPGFLAKAAAKHAGKVIGADVSRGVIACARAINAAPNVEYIVNRTTSLPAIPNDQLDLVYVFAVFQHVTKEQTAEIFAEFRRVLKPGGQGVCHMLLAEPGQEPAAKPVAEGKGLLRRLVHNRLTLRMTYYSQAEMRSLLAKIGFRDIRIVQVKDVANIRDDIGNEHLLLFRK